MPVLDKKDYEQLLSPYLQDGRKHERWNLDRIEMEGKALRALVSMRSTYVSSTDAGGFHLTIFSTLEFLSQLMIIYVHKWAGQTEKKREAWMVESRTHSVRPIRDPAEINVEMNVQSMRRRGEVLYCTAEFAVTDKFGGLFKVGLKGVVA